MHQGSQFQVLTKTRKVTQVNLEGIGSVPDGTVGYLKKKKMHTSTEGNKRSRFVCVSTCRQLQNFFQGKSRNLVSFN